MMDIDEMEAGGLPASGADEKIYQFTESDLQRLLERARVGNLPPGAYIGADGGIKRKIAHPTGRVRNGKLIYHKLERGVIIPAGNSRKSLNEAMLQAKVTGQDVYHPSVGWLRNGWCKETDAPENLGTGVVEYETYEEDITPSDMDDGSTSVTVHGQVAAPGSVHEGRTQGEARPSRRGKPPQRPLTPIPADYTGGAMAGTVDPAAPIGGALGNRPPAPPTEQASQEGD